MRISPPRLGHMSENTAQMRASSGTNTTSSGTTTMTKRSRNVAIQNGM